MASKRAFKAVVQCILFFVCVDSGAAIIIDSLDRKDYQHLFLKINSLEHNPRMQQLYLKAFLAKAKASKNWELIINGYKNYADFAGEPLAIAYTDSMLYTARRSGDPKLIGSSYLSKGIAYYGFKRHELALENYLLAKPYIEKAADAYLEYKLKYNIGHVKYYLGKNDDAITLFNSCLGYFRNNNARAYLNTLHSLGLCYTRAGNYGKSETMVRLGLEEASHINDHSMDPYFIHLEGLNHYFGRNYGLAIGQLVKAISGLQKNGDYANVAVANFYIGKSYWTMKRFGDALPYLKKVAAAFDEKAYIRPDLRENFELLIQYYKKENDSRQVLLYVDRLLKADSLLVKTHDGLYDNIHKNYDTKELVREKQDIETQLAGERTAKNLLTIGVILILLTSVILLVVYERNRRRQNRIYLELLGDSGKEVAKPARNPTKELEIAQETMDKILHALEKWETSRQYLGMDITQSSLAVHLDTNVRYLSSIILHYRGKKFNEYINDLKVDYIIEQLKNDKLKRMYTHDALAKEAGFGTTQRFVLAFKTRTGLSPSFFSAKIRKDMAGANN